MQKQQVLINAFMSVMQIVVISVVLFILYRFLLKTIGVKHLGIWSLVLATSSITQIANLGLSGSVVKFVAKYISRGEPQNISAVIQTAVILVGVSVAFLLVAGYPVLKWLLGFAVQSEYLPLAISVLPFALFSFWFTIVAGIFQAGIDGFQRYDLRSILLIGGTIFNLILCFILAPKYDLMGIAYARVIQNIVLLIFSWLLLKRYISTLPIILYKFNKQILKEIIAYSINFQITTITSMLYDPITKYFLSVFGNLTMVGYYEMASKMIQQFRGIIVSANQVLVPTIAGMKEDSPENIRHTYVISCQLVFYLSLPLYSLIIVSIPLISQIWIGHYENTFIIFSGLLSVGYFLNTLISPAYFANLGTGYLRWNVVGHITIAILNVIFGYFLGLFCGGPGVILGWVFSLTLGSSIIFLTYHTENKISFLETIPQASKIMAAVCFTCMALTVFINFYPFMPVRNLLNYSIPFIFIVIICILFFFHPMRKRVMQWIKIEMKGKLFIGLGKK